MYKGNFNGLPRYLESRANVVASSHCTHRVGAQCEEAASSCSNTRCVGASSVIFKENAKVYYETRQGLVVRRAGTPSNSLDKVALPKQSGLAVTRPWLTRCHQLANKALRKIKKIVRIIVSDGREPRSVKLTSRETTRILQLQGSSKHLLGLSAECTTTSEYLMDRTLQYSHMGIELLRMLFASDNREHRWNCGRGPTKKHAQLTVSSGLCRTSVTSSVSGFPAQTAGGELFPMHRDYKNVSTCQRNPCDALNLMSLYTGHGTERAALCTRTCLLSCSRNCCALSSNKSAKNDTPLSIEWQVLKSGAHNVLGILSLSGWAFSALISLIGTFSATFSAGNSVIDLVKLTIFRFLLEISPGAVVLEFFTKLAGEMLNSATGALRMFETIAKKAKDKLAREQRVKDAQQKDGLGFTQAGRDAAEAGEAKLQLERVKQEEEARKKQAMADQKLMESDMVKATKMYEKAVAAQGDPMARVMANAHALVAFYNAYPVKQTVLPPGKMDAARWMEKQIGITMGAAIEDAERTAMFSFHDAMSSTARADDVLKIRIEAETPLQPGQVLGVEDVAQFWRTETEIPIIANKIVCNTGPWLNPARAGKAPIPSFFVMLETGDQDEVQKLRDLLMKSAGGDPILIGGIATFWTAETPYNVNVEFHASEGANATLYAALCEKAEIPRSILNNMLTEHVRNSPDIEAQNNQILSVSLEGTRFANQAGAELRTRYSLSALDLGAQRFSPTIRINMASAASAAELAKSKKRVNLVVGAKLSPLITVTGTTAARTALQQGAGLAAARKRATQEVDKKLQMTGAIFASLREVVLNAGEGRGDIALKKLLTCQSDSAGNSDVTAAFLYDKIHQEVLIAKATRWMTPEQGEELAEKVAAWEVTLSEEREKHKECGEHLTTLFQLAGFPAAKVKPWHGKDQSSMKAIQAIYHPRNTDVQKDLQRWLKERELLKFLCCVPVLDEEGVWNPEQGVIIATQHAIGFGQAADAAEKMLPRPKTLLPIFANNKQGAQLRKPFQIKVVWPTAGVGLPPAPLEGAEELRQRVVGVLREMEGIWVPEEDSAGETLQFVEGQVVGDVKTSDLTAIDDSATHDVRNLHTLLKVEVENGENLLKVIATMQHEKLITPIAKVGGSVLFVLTSMAKALQHVPGTEEIGVMKDDEWMVGMQAGESVRDWMYEAIVATLWPRLEHKLDGGVWIRGTSFNGQQGLGALDGRDTVEEGAGKRWWRVLAQKHFVGENGYDDIAEMVVRTAIERGKAVAITKQGATLLLRPDSLFASAVLAAENMTPGDPIPTETLTLDSTLHSALGRQMTNNLLAVGKEWAPAMNAQDYGVELINSDIQKRLEKGSMTIEFEVWAAAGQITSESFIRGKRGEEDCLWRPKNQGAAMVFVEGRDKGLGECNVQWTKIFQPHDVPTLPEVMKDNEIGRYGAGGPRILKGLVEKGQAALFQTEGGHVVVIPEKVSVNGQKREFTFEEQFTVEGQAVDIDGEDPLEENLRALELGITRATLEKYSDKAGKLKIEAAVTGDPIVLSGVKLDESGKVLLMTRADEAPAAVNMKVKVGHPLVHNQRGMSWINKLIQKGSTQAVPVGPVQGQVLFFNKATALWCVDIAPETAQAWDPFTQTMQNLQEAATKEPEHPRDGSEASRSDDEEMESEEESLQEEDLMAADADNDGRAAGASQHAAPKGKGAPTPGRRVTAERKRKKGPK